MKSEEEERPRFVKGGYGWHRHQRVKGCLRFMMESNRMAKQLEKDDDATGKLLLVV